MKTKQHTYYLEFDFIFSNIADKSKFIAKNYWRQEKNAGTVIYFHIYDYPGKSKSLKFSSGRSINKASLTKLINKYKSIAKKLKAKFLIKEVLVEIDVTKNFK